MLVSACVCRRSPARHGMRLAVLAALTGLAGLSLDGFAQSLSFRDALAIAVRETPVLRANAAQVDAARAAVTPAGELPDPKLSLGIANLPVQGEDRYSLNSEPMTMRSIGIHQDIPNADKRAARTALAQGRTALAEAETRVARLTVLRETAVAWIERNTVERQLGLIDALRKENDLLAAAVRARIAGGGGGSRAADSVMPRQEAAMIDDRRDELSMRRQQAIAALVRWVGSAGSAPLSGEAPDWQLSRMDLAHTLHRHPELEVFAPKLKVAEAEIAEARAGKRPDWGVDLAYQQRAPQFGDMISVQLRFDLPIFAGSRQDPQIAAREAERTAIDAEREATLRAHSAMLEADWAEYTRLSNALKRQRETMLPLAEEKVRLLTAAWRGSGNAKAPASLADVIAARRERIDTQLKIIAVEGELRKTAARLHYAYGDLSGEQP